MTEQFRIVICYDVADDRRRRRIADRLDGVGDRVQESVFEAMVTDRILNIVKKDIQALIDVSEDRVSIYRLCATCDGRREDLGLKQRQRPGDEEAFIV